MSQPRSSALRLHGAAERIAQVGFVARMTNMSGSGGSSFGDFQADLGRVNSTVGLVSAYVSLVVASILFLLSLYVAAVPRAWGSSNFPCGTEPFPGCLDPDETCREHKCKKKERQNWPIAGGGALILVIAVAGFAWSKWWNKKVQSNRAFAQVSGLGAEIGIAQRLFGNSQQI